MKINQAYHYGATVNASLPSNQDVITDGYSFDRGPIAHLSTMDQKKFIQFGRGQQVELPYAKIHQPFESYAKKNPESIAIEHLEQKITYGHLHKLGNALARDLIELGVQAEDRVGLFIERSIPMVVGLLGTLKAGAAYVPQDIRITPIPQLSHILKSSGIKVVLTLSHLKHRVPATDQTICICLDEWLENHPDLNVGTPRIRTERPEEKTCFVLYTSGTTGQPNGVHVTHQNVCNIVHLQPGGLGIRAGEKVAQILNISFDMAAWEIFGALSFGATLLIRGKDIAKTAEQADVIIATPSILETIDHTRCKNIRVVAVAGEPCPRALAERWSKRAMFYNCCGPTETTIVNTMKRYQPGQGLLTIGTPTPNNTVYVLDEKQRALPIGAIGEMWAGGLCVTKGYIENFKLTRERYRPDPFLGEGYMMFRTRDLGRWTAHGELEHFGRTDDQVKIKGFRVELDSISGALESIRSCRQAVTLKLDSKNLVSFVQPASVDLSQAKQAIVDRLPYYCSPEMIIPLEQFPMTTRGKVDKRALTIMAVEKLESLQDKSHEA